MDRKMLRDKQWARIEQLLPGKASDPVCTAKDNRLFVEAVFRILRTGSPWRDLPCEFGKWYGKYMRFAHWRDSGVWGRVADVLGRDADMEHLFIDSNIVRAHQHTAGAQKEPAVRKSAAHAAGGRPRCM
jgi:transposase